MIYFYAFKDTQCDGTWPEISLIRACHTAQRRLLEPFITKVKAYGVWVSSLMRFPCGRGDIVTGKGL